MAVSFASLNPFSNITFGSLGTFSSITLIIVISVVILGLIGGLIYWWFISKAYWITIEVSRLIGGSPMRVAIYSAKEVPFGMAGDKLWRVANKGWNKLTTIKWLPVGKVQSAPRVWKYWIREDGEWINYQDSNLDEISKRMNVKFVQEDMRLQRLATERLLEQRLMDKTFWEKWQTVIMTVLFFLIIAVSLTIFLYMYSKNIDKMLQIEQVQLESAKILYKTFGENYINLAKNITGGTTGLIPV